MNNVVESIIWVGVGFVPTLIAMEAAWRVSRRRIEKLGMRMH